MTRSFRVWMFACALLSALAVSARAQDCAKPPDLPVDPNDTIPLLTPPSLPEVDETPEPAPMAPLPEPLPGWPIITLEKEHISTQSGIWDNIERATKMAQEPETTLTIYPGPNGIIVGINPEPMPQTVTISHPVRPRMPLSVQRTFDECLLVGAHPLLSLVPLPESLREERHTQEMVPVALLPQPQFNGVVTVTPDLSIPIAPNSFYGGEQQSSQPEPIREMPQPPEDSDPSARQSCPYHGPCDRHVEAIGDEDIAHSVMANLEKLLEAEQFYETACKMAESGHYADAMKCVEKASGLCSPGRFEDMKLDVVSHILSHVICGSGDSADAEESDEPPMECLPDWFGGDETPPPSSAPESHEAPQIMIQALVAEVDMSGCGGFSLEKLQKAKSSEAINECMRTLKAQGRLDVLSRPQVQTLDNQTARVFVGQNFPLITGTTVTNTNAGWPAAAVVNEPTGVELTMTPTLRANGKIQMHVWAKLSSKTVNTDGEGSNTVATRSQMVESTLVAVDGETVVLGGKQLLVILTPHIIRSKADADKILNEENKQTQGCRMPCVAPCKAAGIAEQVTGLMKACHLALSGGDYAKAAQLAREAHALDAERVAADPVVYKMHLLAEHKDKGCCCCPDDCCCGDKDCCCPQKLVVTGGCVMGGILVNNMSAPAVCCPLVQMQPPSLPPVDATVVVELQQLLDEKAETATAKPALEVVEEESEAHEAPKAVAKPFRVQMATTGMVISFDELLKFIPGETWTEFDPTTNHVRALYRVRVGNAVYCVRYDGELSVDLSVTPSTGCGEKCEGHK